MFFLYFIYLTINITYIFKVTVKDKYGLKRYEERYNNVNSNIVVLPFVYDLKSVESIQISLKTNRNVIPGSVSCIELTKASGNIYKYDEENHLIVKKDGSSTISYSNFQNDLPTTISSYDMYGNTQKQILLYNELRQVVYSEDDKGNCEENVYDKLGNVIESKRYNKQDSTSIENTKVRYDEQGRILIVDGIMKKEDKTYPSTNLTYNQNTGMLEKIKGPNGQTTTYGYDYFNDKLIEMSSDDNGIANTNKTRYDFGYVTALSHHGFDINYTKDSLGRNKVVNFGNIDYLKVNYEDYFAYKPGRIGNKTTTTYANNLIVSNVSNELGNVVETTITDGSNIEKCSYQYDKFNQLKEVVCSNGQKQTIIYDDFRNVININTLSKDQKIINEEYVYNKENVVETTCLTMDNVTTKNNFIYDYKTKLLKEVEFNQNSKVSFAYDSLSKPIKQELIIDNKELLCNEYEYLKYDENITSLIKEHKVKINGELNEVLTYDYDVSGNITKVSSSDNDILYHYDLLNRLVREDNIKLASTTTFKYDVGGNIVMKKVYPFTLDSKLIGGKVYRYSYNCKNWKDQLISYDGEKVEYDIMGCPRIYRNNILKWSNKKELLKYNDFEYKYNINKIRTSKVVDGVVTEFYLKGSTILRSVSGNGEGKVDLIFRRIVDKLVGFSYNNNEYYYKVNIQGDIIAIVDSMGNVVSSYEYDAWGNHIVLDSNGLKNTSSDFIGNINPFRYRGYYYDCETGLYLLTSRYYDPEIGRFISADSIDYLNPESINGLNLYAYANNNPIMFCDPSGCFAISTFLIGLAVSWAVSSIASHYLGANLVSGIGLSVGGVQTIGVGVSLLAFGPVGWVLGGIAIASGIGSLAFATAELQQHFTGNNWMKDAGMSDGWYTGLMIGNTIVSAATSIAGVKYMNSSAGQRAYDIQRNAKYWDRGTFKTRYGSLNYHLNEHGRGLTATQYTNKALSFMDANANLLRYNYSSRYEMVRWIYSRNGQTGYYSTIGKIITFMFGGAL